MRPGFREKVLERRRSKKEIKRTRRICRELGIDPGPKNSYSGRLTRLEGTQYYVDQKGRRFCRIYREDRGRRVYVRDKMPASELPRTWRVGPASRDLLTIGEKSELVERCVVFKESVEDLAQRFFVSEKEVRRVLSELKPVPLVPREIARGKRFFTKMLTDTILQKDPATGKFRAENICERLTMLAEQGNLVAIGMVADRVEGRAVQAVEVSGREGQPIQAVSATMSVKEMSQLYSQSLGDLDRDYGDEGSIAIPKDDKRGFGAPSGERPEEGDDDPVPLDDEDRVDVDEDAG